MEKMEEETIEPEIVHHRSALESEHYVPGEIVISTAPPAKRSQLVDFETQLVIFEALVTFSTATAEWLIVDYAVAVCVSIDIFNAIVYSCLGHSIAMICNPFIGALADSVTGKFCLTVSGIFCLLASIITCQLLSFEAVLRITGYIFLIISAIFLICFKATLGTKEALLFTLINRKQHEKIEHFIFLIYFSKNISYIVVTTGFFIGTYYNEIEMVLFCMGIISGILSLCLLCFLRKEIQPETIDRNIVTKCIISLISRKKKSAEKYKYYSKISKKSLKMLMVLVTIIGFSVSYYLLIMVILKECISSQVYDAYRTTHGTAVVIYSTKAITVTFLYYSFIHVIRKLKIVEVDLHLQLIAYKFMAIALFLLCLGLVGLRYTEEPKDRQAQYRLYNGAKEVIKISCSICDITELNPGKLHVIKEVPCEKKCSHTIQIEFQQSKKNMTALLKSKESQSFTAIVNENEVVLLKKADPLEAPENMSSFVIISNIDDINVVFSFDRDYEVHLVRNVRDVYFLSVLSQFRFNGFTYNGQIYNDTVFELEQRVYSVFIYVSPNGTTYDVSEIQLLVVSSVNTFLIILPTLVGIFAHNIGMQSLTRFIILETPPNLYGTMHSFLMLWTNIGILCWSMTYSPTTQWITSIAFFILLHYASYFSFQISESAYNLWSKT